MIEKDIVYFLNHFGNKYIDLFSIFISNYIFIIFLFTIIIFIFLYFDEKRFKKLFISMIIALSLYFLITELFIKDFLANFSVFRIMPYLAYPDIIPLGEKVSDSSFPSSHIAGVSAFFSVLIYNYRKTKIYSKSLFLAIIFIVLMAFSRMHNGMHYPSDVLAGILLGILYGVIGVVVVEKVFRIQKP